MHFRSFLRCSAALSLAAAAGVAAAHDTWFRVLPVARPGEALLLLGTGNRFPVQEFAIAPEHLRLSGCRSGESAASLAPVGLTANALLMRASAAAGVARGSSPALTCWAQLAPFDVELTSDVVNVYFDEIAAPAAVREAWAAMQSRGVRWTERFTKHARIELGAAAAQATSPVADIGMDVLLTRPGGAPRVGDELVFQVLREGRPLAGFAVELRSERANDAAWLTTDGEGRVRWRPPAAGAWVLRGTHLRLAEASPDRWESRFVTLAFQVAAAP